MLLETSSCPECNGTGKYVGLLETSSCRSCQSNPCAEIEVPDLLDHRHTQRNSSKRHG